MQDAEGSFERLNGEYELKVDALEKPDPNCLDSCVYTRRGDPEMAEYCFSQMEHESASVSPFSCPATSTLASFGTSSLPSESTSAAASDTTAAISVLNLQEETEKHIADLDNLINNEESSPALTIELNKLKDLLIGLSGSLSTVVESGRVKRSTAMSCSDLTVIITAHEYVITLVEDILNHMNTIGTDTGNTDLDNFIATTIQVFSQIDVKPQLEQFKGIQTEQCSTSTPPHSTAKDPST